jgi:hypothetical protein
MALRTDKKGRGIGGRVPPALEAGEVYVLSVPKAMRAITVIWLARAGVKSGEGLPYADGATAQTRPNEAAEVGVRSIKTYPALWLLLVQFVGVHYRGHDETFDET